MATPVPSRPQERDNPPLAYLITFRTFGTWLHGDARGSVDRGHNLYGTVLLDPDCARERAEAKRMAGSAVTLDAAGRDVVERAVRGVCEHRCWPLVALNVRSNHVHVVLSTVRTPERVLVDLKAWATRRLVEAGLVGQGRKVWSYHGSTRYLWTRQALEDACRYVVDGQGDGDDPPMGRPGG